MSGDRLRKLFGVGPMGAVLSLVLLAVALLVDHRLGRPAILSYRPLMRGLGVVLVLAGLVLHFRTMYTLRTWWVEGRLCTDGPFQMVPPSHVRSMDHLRLPGRGALSRFVGPDRLDRGLHPLWRVLVTREEKMMARRFPDEYPPYAARTGRFIPRLAFR